MSAVAVVRQRVAGQSLAEEMHDRVNAAAATFESRWTMRALQRVDAELAQAVEDQNQLFAESLIIGDEKDIIDHGEAMVRGWAIAVSRMESANVDDDAYILGQCFQTGLKVAVGLHRASSARVRELHGDMIVFLHPDEVASVFAGMQILAKIKSLWPDAEIVGVRKKVVDVYPDEPAKADSGIGD